MQEVIELSSVQEEADTRLLLYAKHAATPHVKAVIISSEDTDVRILCILFAHAIPVPIYQRCVSQHQARYVDISKIARVLGQEVSKALFGLHAFTGCDSVTSWASERLGHLNCSASRMSSRSCFKPLGNSGLL